MHVEVCPRRYPILSLQMDRTSCQNPLSQVLACQAAEGDPSPNLHGGRHVPESHTDRVYCLWAICHAPLALCFL